MALVPPRFLLRVAHPCRYAKTMPLRNDARLLELPSDHRIDNFAAIDGLTNFADVCLAWNEFGIGLQVEVRGKQQLPVGNPDRPRGSDGVTLWLDTRDARAGHRASRYCHQFHFLATGAGAEHDEPALVQAKINRALEDAPIASAGNVLLKVQTRKSGYVLEAFLPAAVLNGYDPDEHRRLGFFYAVHDDELGEQLVSMAPEFPYWEDPSLWSVLELIS
ncbi:MAG: hypothetical protein HY289_15380 [Planctomycetes bacterium]|nr:hypothetical protein [Planctomycetota bacterium]